MERGLGLGSVGVAVVAMILACGGEAPVPQASPPDRSPEAGATAGATASATAEEEVERPMENRGEVRPIHPVRVSDLDRSASAAYPAWNAIDGSLATTWVAGDEPLQLSLPMSYPTHIELVPGYAIDARRWAKNRRPLKVKVRLSQLGSNEEWGPWWEHELDTPDTLPDDPYIRLELPDRSTGADAMQIAVVEATPGGPGIDDDVCISDIRVFGRMFSDQSMGDVWVDATHSPRPDLDTSGTLKTINPCLSLIDGEPYYREGCVQQY